MIWSRFSQALQWQSITDAKEAWRRSPGCRASVAAAPPEYPILQEQHHWNLQCSEAAASKLQDCLPGRKMALSKSEPDMPAKTATPCIACRLTTLNTFAALSAPCKAVRGLTCTCSLKPSSPKETTCKPEVSWQAASKQPAAPSYLRGKAPGFKSLRQLQGVDQLS